MIVDDTRFGGITSITQLARICTNLTRQNQELLEALEECWWKMTWEGWGKVSPNDVGSASRSAALQKAEEAIAKAKGQQEE